MYSSSLTREVSSNATTREGVETGDTRYALDDIEKEAEAKEDDGKEKGFWCCGLDCA
jgi:hypothetical protein